MAHPEQQQFCRDVAFFLPAHFTGKRRVLDVGSQDINGNNRGLFGPDCDYLGIDVGPGPNVDCVCPAHQFKDTLGFDTIISTECFEHDDKWNESIRNIVVNLLRPGGLFLFTCAAPGRPEHGTRQSSPESSPFTSDYYRNLDEADIRDSIYAFEHWFSGFGFRVRTTWPQDLYFWGVKRT